MDQNKNLGITDKILGELALKIETELPEEIIRYVAFGQDVEAKNLVIDWALQLSTEDLKLLTDVVTGYGGCYTNSKDEHGKDRGVFLIPNNQPPIAITSDGDKLTGEKPKKFTEGDSKVASAAGQQIKQQCPLTLFQERNCSSCSDQATCNPRTSVGRQRLAICFKVMELHYFDFIAERLLKLCQIQEDNGKILLQIQPQGKPSTLSSNAQPSSQAKLPESSPQPTPVAVQRNMRPIEGHQEGGIIWVFDENKKGERYEKAFEKDNLQSTPYFGLRDRIIEVVNQGKKGLVDNGKWLWLSERGDYIGRKAARQFPRGGRRY